MKPYSEGPPDTAYEELLHDLFRESGFQVAREPRINGKTPDLLVQGVDGSSCIVECTTVHWEGKHNSARDERGWEWLMVDNSDPSKRNQKLWDKINGKLRSYKADTFPGYGLVIAIYNWSFFSYDINAVEVCFGQFERYITLADGEAAGTGWKRALDPEFDLPIFHGLRNQHCSAIIHSTGLFHLVPEGGEYKLLEGRDARHLLVPNPNATQPVLEKLFPFCDVLDLPKLINADYSVPKRKPLT